MIKRRVQKFFRRLTGMSESPRGVMQSSRRRVPDGKVRYAVVGLGHISQIAVLPAFRHAKKNSELTALVSSDPVKRRELGRRYRVPIAVDEKDYDDLLRSGDIDAVYVAEPNSRHREFTVRAAEAGIHVLCEKPLAVTEADCELMIDACREHGVKLMTAYRLHFERANLEAIKVVQSGKIGEPRFFNSIFSMQARPGNIRLQRELGGGPVFDLGVYCINAARYLFRAEPIEVSAMTVSGNDRRFREVEETAGAVLRFPGDRLATFVCSFGAADSGEYQVVGTKGSLHLKNAYEYALPIEMEIKAGEKTQKREFDRRDQFGPELLYFSECVLKDKEPEPSGVEGLNDVRIIQAIFDSARRRAAIQLPPASKKERPTTRQEIRRRPVEEPDLVNAKSGSKD